MDTKTAKSIASFIKYHKERKQMREDLVDILYEANGTGSGADDIIDYIYNGFKLKKPSH